MLCRRLRSFPFLVFVLLALSVPASSHARVDTTDSEKEYRLDTSLKVYPSPIWSETSGFSAGVGYEVENLLMPRGRLLATVKPGQHLGRYTLTYFARDAFSDRVYGLANLYYETTGRQWYYGTGPTSSHDHRLGIEKEMVEAELRLGFQPFGRVLFVQPVLKYIRQSVDDFRSFDEGALERLSPESLHNLRYSSGLVSGSSRVQEGLSYGLSAGIDLRDSPMRTRSGLLLQGSASRYRFDVPDGLEFDRYDLFLYGYLPLRNNMLGLRVAVAMTESAHDVTIPFYLLPTLHGRLLPGYSWNRFFGRDLFVATAEYAVPLFDLFNFAALDALFSVGAGSVYNDIFDEFDPSLTFETDVQPGSSYPLRPSASAGVQLESLSRHGFDFRVLLGWGTEGMRLIRFEFVHDLRDIELGRR